MLPPLRSPSRWALLGSVLLAACSTLSDVDAEFTGGLPEGAGGAGNASTTGGSSGASSTAGRGGSGGFAGASGAGATMQAGASGELAGGAAGAVASGAGGLAAGGVGGGASGSGGGGLAGAAGKSGGSGSGGKGTSGQAGSASGASGSGGKAGASGGGAGTSSGGAGVAGNASGTGGLGGLGGASAGAAGAGTGGASAGSAGASGGGGKAGASGGGAAGNAGQAGAGGACGVSDVDCDAVAAQDNCPSVANPDQSDQDSDKIGDLCDGTPGGADPSTQWGACGELSGTAAVEIVSAPTSSCAGQPLTLSYRAGGALPCGSTIAFRAYRKIVGGLSAPTPLGTTTSLGGSFEAAAAAALSPGEWYLEAAVGTVASKRFRVSIGGATLSLSVPRKATLEGGPVDVVFGTTPSSPATTYTLTVDGDSAPATSPKKVAIAGLGKHDVTVAAKTPDGCTTTQSEQVEMFTCHPVVPATTALSPASGNAKSVLVCDGAAHTMTGGIVKVYARPNASVHVDTGISTVWLSLGATVTQDSGVMTLLYAGPKPTVAGGIVTYLACPDIAFDESALTPTCPVP